MAISLCAHACGDLHEWTILKRLSTDERMRAAWTELTRFDRKTGAFVHPAFKRRESSIEDQNDIQHEALGLIYLFAFRAAADHVPVTKFAEQGPLRLLAEQRARTLNEIAEDLEPIGPQVLAEVAALRRVAAWQEQIAEALRPQNDPLTISNDRGDRIERGVQIVLAAQLQETFGKHLHGTAARLATVALGLDRLLKARASRSAFSKGSRARKS